MTGGPRAPLNIGPDFWRIMREFVAACEAEDAAEAKEAKEAKRPTGKKRADDGTYRAYWSTPAPQERAPEKD